MNVNRLCMLALALLLPAVAVTNAQEGVQIPDKEAFHLYLLVGQSNMAGRGKVSPEDLNAHPRVLTLSKDQNWKLAVDPIHFDKSVAGVGLGRTFGTIIADARPKITIGLIPCAAGGSAISTWKPGGYHKQTKSHPYDDAIERAHAALRDGTLKGILWHQGESDSKEGLSEIYEQQLHQLIARFRKELDAPDVPFIVGQLGQFSERPWNAARKQVDLAHRSLPSKVAATAFVGSEGLDHKGDEVHFDTDSYHELGRRYAKAMRELAAAKQKAKAAQPQ